MRMRTTMTRMMGRGRGMRRRMRRGMGMRGGLEAAPAKGKRDTGRRSRAAA